jgi:hypothetical protein
MIRPLVLAALLAAPVPAQAQQCIPAKGLGDAAVVFAPFLIDSVIKGCAASLPADAFINKGAAAFSERFRNAGTTRIDSAVQALQLAMGEDFPKIEDRKALVQVLGELGSGFIARDIDKESCVGLNGMLLALDPLPPESVALLGSSFAQVLAAGENAKARKREVKIVTKPKRGEEAVPSVEADAARRPKICPDG